MLTALGSVLLAPIARAQQKPGAAADAAKSRAVVVQLNGRRFADAVAVNTGGREEVLVPVIALARALDGPSGSIGKASPRARLRLDGHKLFAAAHGGCDRCPARVTRLVVISARVRAVGGAPALPLSDLVAAFEGRLEIDSARTLYGIHAGKCTWCILGPR